MKQTINPTNYFKKNKAFKRIFEAMLKQWSTYGYCAGVIKILGATENEKEVLGQFMGKHYIDKDLIFKFKDFEKALEDTIFNGMGIQKVLESYFEISILTNKEITISKKSKHSEFFAQLMEELVSNLKDSNLATQYLVHIQENKDYAYPQLMREYQKNKDNAINMFVRSWQAIEQLARNKQKIHLAVLSSNVCGIPHYFDRDNVAGKFLIYALSFINNSTYPANAEEIVNLYYNFNVLPDSLTNFTAGFGLHLYTSGGEHMAYEIFNNYQESYIITLSNLSNIVMADHPSKRVYVVENQMLFSQIIEKVKKYDVAILCTSGQMKLASLVLIDLLCKSNCTIYYAGDFDPEGILIADRVISRNPQLIVPWFYQVKDYEKAISSVLLSNERLKQLDNVKSDMLQRIVESMMKEKKAGYQEKLLDEMIEDIINNSSYKENLDK